MLSGLLDQLPAHLGPLEGEPVALEGGITNRNFRLRLGGEDYVLRVAGKDTDVLGIDRAAECAASELAARAGVGPEVVASVGDPPSLLTRFIGGRPMTEADLREPVRIQALAAGLRAIHDSGERLPSTFDPFRVVEDYAAQARARGGEVPADYDEVHAWAQAIEAVLEGPEHDPVPIHADLLAGNVIEAPDGGLRIVDWEYAGMGDRYFDLGNLAVNNGFEAADEARLLEAYFGEPPDARRRATLALLRLMSDFREAMWGVLQREVSALDFDFAAYADEHFARLRMAAAELDGWLEDARGTA